jgi:hypothetical protein
MHNPTPTWVWMYEKKESLIEDLLCDLINDDSRAVDSERYTNNAEFYSTDFSTHRLKLHKMDFVTGATSSSMVQYYKPNRTTKCKIGNTSLDPKNPTDDLFLFMLNEKNDPKFDGQKLHQQLRRSFVKYITHSPGGSTAPSGWQFIK